MEKFDELLRSLTLDFFGNGRHKVSPSSHLNGSNSVILDVRSKEEYETLALKLYYHIPVVHIPINEIPDRINELPKDKIIGVFCSAGTRATIVYTYLRLKGYSPDQVKVIEGGYAELAMEFMPGKLLKKITKGQEDAK